MNKFSATGAIMKKLAMIIAALFFMVSCSSRHSPATSPFSPAYYTNSGKIKTSDLTTDILLTTVDGTYYYDTAGRIRRIDNTILSLPAASTYYQYASSGKVSFIGDPGNPAANGNESFSYDSSNRLSVMNFTATNSTTSNDVQTLNYGGDGYADTINETQNGVTSCYRVITRDANGYIIREDIYPAQSSTTEFAYITFTRDGTHIIEDIYFGAVDMFTIEATYDATGFISQLVYAEHAGLVMNITQNFYGQSGPFDPAGLDGYYYTDKDLFGFAHDTINTSVAGQ
jgi:hypothetical protein